MGNLGTLGKTNRKLDKNSKSLVIAKASIIKERVRERNVSKSERERERESESKREKEKRDNAKNRAAACMCVCVNGCVSACELLVCVSV